MISKEMLDKRICDFIEGANNTQTCREFIRESEKYFELCPVDLDNMTEKNLNAYLDWLNELWDK